MLHVHSQKRRLRLHVLELGTCGVLNPTGSRSYPPRRQASLWREYPGDLDGYMKVNLAVSVLCRCAGLCRSTGNETRNSSN